MGVSITLFIFFLHDLLYYFVENAWFYHFYVIIEGKYWQLKWVNKEQWLAFTSTNSV